MTGNEWKQAIKAEFDKALDDVQIVENKAEKRFTVALELTMSINVNVSAADEQAAQTYAMEILKDKLCAPGNSDIYFCEIDDSDVFVNYADIVPMEVGEAEEE